MSIRTLFCLSFVWCFIGAHAQAVAKSPTLDKIRASKNLNCGVNVEEAEYSMDAHGNHTLLDIEFCKAVAVAVLGPKAPYKIKIYRDEEEALAGLKSGDSDVLASGSANFRSTDGVFTAAHVIYYDFQGLLVNATNNYHSVKDLQGKRICFLISSELETQIQAYMTRQKIPFLPGPYSEEGEMELAFVTGHCDAVSADVTQLAYERISFKKMAPQFEILQDVIAPDPLAPLTRSDDPFWSAVVDWTVQALIQAEQLGITQANLPDMLKSEDIVIQRLLGTNRGWAQFIGLNDSWAADIIVTVGNYGEIFERTLGANSPMRLRRGVNRIWTEGGLLYADPIR